MQTLPLIVQTAYAELLERCAAAAFEESFPEPGAFTPKTIRGRRYWYFQPSDNAERKQRYVGPETELLLDQIARHRQWQDDRRERRALVSTLTRTAGVPQPLPRIGELVAALARTGIFRRRAVLVGTVAYHTYAPMLGVKLPDAALTTYDVDIAQDHAISLNINEDVPALLDTLKADDPHIEAIESLHPSRHASYRSNGLRVDILTTNRGPDTDEPVPLPALGSDATPLRFLDFLIRDPVPAVLLYQEGVYVHVPAPARYAIHKLIVSTRRSVASAKAPKDVQQADALIDGLVGTHPGDLVDTWNEGWGRGKSWQQALTKAVNRIKPTTRDRLLQRLGWPRAEIDAPPLQFDSGPPIYDADRDIVRLRARTGNTPAQVAISREALEDHFGAGEDGKDDCLKALRESQIRREIEHMAEEKYLHVPIDRPDITLLRTEDIEPLRRRVAQSSTGSPI